MEDIAGINVKSLTKGDGVYNVGTGRPTSLLDIVRMLNRAAGLDIPPKISGEFRPGDNRHDFADNSRLRKAFGDITFTDIQDGMKRLVEWSSGAQINDMFEKEERERRKYLKS